MRSPLMAWKSTQKNDEYLKERADVNITNDIADFPAFSLHKRSKNMYSNENSHPHPANAMQDKGQKWTLSLVSQSRLQAYIPFQAH